MQLLPIDKYEARTYFAKKRNELTADFIEKSSKIICEYAFQKIVSLGTDTVLMFSPIKNEPQIDSLADNLLKIGFNVFYPISQKEDFTLSFHKISALSDLSAGAYGIKEPPIHFPKFKNSKNSVCIVPALSFDTFGMRIGYGKGYYDRFLNSFLGTSIGVTFSDFLVDKLSVNKHDIPVNFIITEGGITLSNEAKKLS